MLRDREMEIMAVIKARENSSDTFTPVATMGVGNASQSQRGLMTAQDKVKVDSIGTKPSGETDTLWDKIDILSNKKITFTKLVDNKTIPTNLTTYSLENDEKFSNYDLILVVNNASDFSNRGSMLLPLGAFVSAPNNYIQVLHGSTAGSASGYLVSTLSFKYANDRQYQTALAGSGALNIISIYGIKLG